MQRLDVSGQSKGGFIAEVLQTVLSEGALLFLAATTLLCTLAGPFGTYDHMTLPIRYLFWFGITAGGMLMFVALRLAAVRWIGPGRQMRFDLCLLAGMTTGMAAYAALMYRLAGAEDLYSYTQTQFHVIAITATVYALRRVIPGLEDPRCTLAVDDQRTKDPASEQARLSRRLNNPDADILRLSVEDHFVNVVTTEGTERLRMRFTDAIDEMAPVDGFCTHRSHWVVESHVRGMSKDGSRIAVEMSNGDLIPVSRKYRPDLEERALGWA